MPTWQETLVTQLDRQGLRAPQASELPQLATMRRACDEFLNWARPVDNFTVFVLRQLQHVPNTLVASGLCPSWPGLLTMIPDTMNVFEGWDKFCAAVAEMRQEHRGSAEDLDLQTELDGVLALS